MSWKKGNEPDRPAPALRVRPDPPVARFPFEEPPDGAARILAFRGEVRAGRQGGPAGDVIALDLVRAARRARRTSAGRFFYVADDYFRR